MRPTANRISHLLAGVGALMLASVTSTTSVSASETPVLSFRIEVKDFPLGGNGVNTWINDAGVVAGTTYETDGSSHGFLWENGNTTPFDVPGQFSTSIEKINSNGVLVGVYDDGVTIHGYTYDTDRRKWKLLLDAPGFDLTYANGINNHGTIVGNAWRSDFTYGSGWVLNGTTWSFFNVLDGNGEECATIVRDINDHGVITGWYYDANGQHHAFVKDGEKVTTLDAPNGGNTLAFQINNEGDVVGDWNQWNPVTGFWDVHGFIFRHGKLISYDVPGITPGYTFLNSINDNGQVTGGYVDVSQDGAFIQFIGTPVEAHRH